MRSCLLCCPSDGVGVINNYHYYSSIIIYNNYNRYSTYSCSAQEINRMCIKMTVKIVTCTLNLHTSHNNNNNDNNNRYIPLNLKRRDEVIIIRSRIGHTHLTHSFLISKEPAPGGKANSNIIRVNKFVDTHPHSAYIYQLSTYSQVIYQQLLMNITHPPPLGKIVMRPLFY